MTVRLVDEGWDQEIASALSDDASSIRLVCPFIKRRSAQRLIDIDPSADFRVVTRFDLAAFARGVSDIAALRTLMAAGARVRGLQGVHAKVYLLGARTAIVTSANLTERALCGRNEFGVATTDPTFTRDVTTYFEQIWTSAGDDATPAQLDAWEAQVDAARLRGGRPSEIDQLPDLGTAPVAPLAPVLDVLPEVAQSEPAHVKFFGEASRRERRDALVLDEVRRSGCHWACTYPRGRRPRQPQTGDTMYLARLVKSPDDILVFGRATVVRAHEEIKDDATPAEVAARSFKAQWPHYVRVTEATFLDGPLGNGVSLNALMSALKHDAFAATQENKAAGRGNVNPRRAYNEQPAVRLTAEGATWIARRLEAAMQQNGTLQPATLEQLDWPSTI